MNRRVSLLKEYISNMTRPGIVTAVGVILLVLFVGVQICCAKVKKHKKRNAEVEKMKTFRNYQLNPEET